MISNPLFNILEPQALASEIDLTLSIDNQPQIQLSIKMTTVLSDLIKLKIEDSVLV